MTSRLCLPFARPAFHGGSITITRFVFFWRSCPITCVRWVVGVVPYMLFFLGNLPYVVMCALGWAALHHNGTTSFDYSEVEGYGATMSQELTKAWYFSVCVPNFMVFLLLCSDDANRWWSQCSSYAFVLFFVCLLKLIFQHHVHAICWLYL
jgi:hypothetical protein